MGLFSFLKPAPTSIAADLSFIGIDMHSHILPSLDDGSKSLQDSIRFIKELKKLGYKKLICTPHIMGDTYPNSKETITPAYNLVVQQLKEQNIEVEIGFAAEFMVNAEFENWMASNQILKFGANYVLIEMSYMAPSPNIKAVIFNLIMQGYKPVLAHPERYNYYHTQFEVYEDFIDSGCLLQVNLLSLTGYYGKAVKKIAEALIAKKMISFAGTDLHHQSHLDMLQKLATNPNIINQLKTLKLKNSSL